MSRIPKSSGFIKIGIKRSKWLNVTGRIIATDAPLIAHVIQLVIAQIVIATEGARLKLNRARIWLGHATSPKVIFSTIRVSCGLPFTHSETSLVGLFINASMIDSKIKESTTIGVPEFVSGLVMRYPLAI